MFNKRKHALAAANARAEALQRQVDEADQRSAELEDRITVIAGVNAQLDTRLGALDDGVRSLGEQVGTLSSSNETRSGEFDEINERLNELSLRQAASAPVAQSMDPPPPPSQLHTAGDDLDQRLADVRTELDRLAEQNEHVDERVTRVSTELANQLTELSRDIEELEQRRGATAGSPGTLDADVEERLTEHLNAAIEDVLDTTEHLATEQARYEIQFRADLAELADRIRRPSGS